MNNNSKNSNSQDAQAKGAEQTATTTAASKSGKGAKSNKSTNQATATSAAHSAKYSQDKSLVDLESWLADLKALFSGSDELNLRTLQLGKKVNIVSLDTMVAEKKILDSIVTPLVSLGKIESAKQIKDSVAFSAKVTVEANYDSMLNNFFNGNTVIFVEGDSICLSIGTRTDLSRAIIEPATSLVLRGPREGFVEDIKVNLTLLRKRLRTPDFKTFSLSIGKYTNTSVSVCYIESIADKGSVNKIIQRLQSIDIDGVLDSSYLSRYLDKPKTLFFNRVGEAEKPDIVVGKMLEGRIAIVVDGSPMVLTVPYLFIEDLQGPNDYQQSSEVSTLGRMLRLLSVIASVLLPALYVSFQNFNYQIIPIKFLITILNSTATIPFTPLTEMLVVIIIFDILREANLRMPSAVGMSLSLVGAIILGEAAVAAGLLGAPAVMIGALSGVGLYTMPDNTLVVSLLRLVSTFIGGMTGLLGIVLCLMALIAQMTGLQQLGSPFLAPFAPSTKSGVFEQDALFIDDLPEQVKRPSIIKNNNSTRRGSTDTHGGNINEK